MTDFFDRERPEYVFLAAARVGGIRANSTYPAEFIYDNLMIQTNVIHQAYRHGVKKLLFLGSSCIYPKFCPQPMKEEYLLDGKLEPTNEPYAVAKIAGIKMCQAYNRQYGTCFISAMPTNLYGPGDNFDLLDSHVIPALIRKFHEAKVAGAPEVVVWGTGTPRREFLYVDDLADACLFLMERYQEGEIINVGVGQDVQIMELARPVAAVIGYQGQARSGPQLSRRHPQETVGRQPHNRPGLAGPDAPRGGLTKDLRLVLPQSLGARKSEPAPPPRGPVGGNPDPHFGEREVITSPRGNPLGTHPGAPSLGSTQTGLPGRLTDAGLCCISWVDKLPERPPVFLLPLKAFCPHVYYQDLTTAPDNLFDPASGGLPDGHRSGGLFLYPGQPLSGVAGIRRLRPKGGPSYGYALASPGNGSSPWPTPAVTARGRTTKTGSCKSCGNSRGWTSRPGPGRGVVGRCRDYPGGQGRRGPGPPGGQSLSAPVFISSGS